MNNLIDKILTEWSYRVHDGMPDLTNPMHLVILQESLDELHFPRRAKEKLLQNLRELEFSDKGDFQKYKSKHKMRKSTKVDIGGKETTVGDAEDNGSDESSGKEYLTDLGIEVPEGLSDEEIESIVKTEKQRS